MFSFFSGIFQYDAHTNGNLFSKIANKQHIRIPFDVIRDIHFSRKRNSLNVLKNSSEESVSNIHIHYGVLKIVYEFRGYRLSLNLYADVFDLYLNQNNKDRFYPNSGFAVLPHKPLSVHELIIRSCCGLFAPLLGRDRRTFARLQNSRNVP